MHSYPDWQRGRQDETQCVGSEKIISDPDPTSQVPVIPDPDPTVKVILDLISVPGENQTF